MPTFGVLEDYYHSFLISSPVTKSILGPLPLSWFLMNLLTVRLVYGPTDSTKKVLFHNSPWFRVGFEVVFGWCRFYCLKIIGETYLWWCRKVALNIALIHHFNFMYGHTKFFTFWTDGLQHYFCHIINNFTIKGSWLNHMIIQTKVSKSIFDLLLSHQFYSTTTQTL